MLGTILLVFAFVVAILASVGLPPATPPAWKLGWLAFSFFIAALLFGGVGVGR